MKKIFDTHAHYDDEAFVEDQKAVILSRHEEGIEKIVNIAASVDSCKTTYDLIQKYNFVYGALGVHPSEVGPMTEKDIEWIRERCKDPKVCAIGEIGLDYYWDKAERGLQEKWFCRQLELAKEVDLPIVVHSREAAADTLAILQREHGWETGGVIHCYSYSAEMAKQYLDMDFFFGIGGVVTYKNAQKLKTVVEYLPLDHIVLETDSPYLSPEPFRGKRNDSGRLPYVVEEIARIKKILPEEVLEETWKNAHRLYRLEE